MEKIIIDNGNAGTAVVYDEQQSSIFWSSQSTDSFHENKQIIVIPDNHAVISEKMSSFDKKLKGLLSVPKPKK